MSCVLVVVMPAISTLKRPRTKNWELQVGKLSKNRRYVSFSFAFFFLLFIHFTFDVTVLSFFISFCLLWLWLYQILDFKIKFKIFLLTLTLRLLAMVIVSQCLLVTPTSEPVATTYECIFIYADQVSVQIDNACRELYCLHPGCQAAKPSRKEMIPSIPSSVILILASMVPGQCM